MCGPGEQYNNGTAYSNPSCTSCPEVAGGVVAGLVVIGIIVFILHRKAGSNGVQRNQRNNVEADELRDRGATLEMVQNPMREQQPTAAPQPSASPPEVGGVAYSRSANSVVAPGSNTGAYENTSRA
eukprot:gene12743-14210_t